jgi:enamine deaminase RidA (YjgF/YER057c/UK114 family)
VNVSRKFRVVKNAIGREVVTTGTPWEPVIGYSRAMRVGRMIVVTGSIGLGLDGGCPESPSEQMRNALGIVVRAIEALGGRREDIVRTRTYLTDIDLWEEVGRIHGEVLGDLLPATTMVAVSRLVDPAAVLEVEAEAIVNEE